MISRKDHTPKRKSAEEPINGLGEITFPPVSRVNNSSDPIIIKAYISKREVNRVYMDSGSSCEVIYEHYFLKLKPSIRLIRVDSKVPLVAFSREHSWPLEEVPLEITIEERTKKPREMCSKIMRNVLSCGDAEEKIIVNTKYPEKTVVIRKQLPIGIKEKLRDLLIVNIDVFAWTYAHMTGIPRTIMVGGKSFNTEHNLNEYKHVKPIKKKRRRLGPDRNEATCKEMEELTKTGILQMVKNQTWVANPVMGVELNYPTLENLIMALVHIAKVWVHDIEFGERDSSKTEQLKDFSIEIPSEEGEKIAARKVDTEKESLKSINMWKLYTDGASSSDNSGARLMLIIPEGKEYTYALRFRFESTNNEVEYEALLAGYR
ncbi:reverse transcriptase domain-containing protein [Tanacetum coccineum]